MRIHRALHGYKQVILKKKGLAVGNDGDVVNFLNHVNYYRCSNDSINMQILLLIFKL